MSTPTSSRARAEREASNRENNKVSTGTSGHVIQRSKMHPFTTASTSQLRSEMHEAIFFKGDSVEINGRHGTISGESDTHWTVRIGNKEEKISKNSKVLQPITEKKEITTIQRYADFIKDQLKNEQNSSIARSDIMVNESEHPESGEIVHGDEH